MQTQTVTPKDYANYLELGTPPSSTKLYVAGELKVEDDVTKLLEIETEFEKLTVSPYSQLRVFNQTARHLHAEGSSITMLGPASHTSIAQLEGSKIKSIAGSHKQLLLRGCQTLQNFDPHTKIDTLWIDTPVLYLIKDLVTPPEILRVSFGNRGGKNIFDTKGCQYVGERITRVIHQIIRLAHCPAEHLLQEYSTLREIDYRKILNAENNQNTLGITPEEIDEKLMLLARKKIEQTRLTHPQCSTIHQNR